MSVKNNIKLFWTPGYIKITVHLAEYWDISCKLLNNAHIVTYFKVTSLLFENVLSKSITRCMVNLGDTNLLSMLMNTLLIFCFIFCSNNLTLLLRVMKIIGSSIYARPLHFSFFFWGNSISMCLIQWFKQISITHKKNQ